MSDQNPQPDSDANRDHGEDELIDHARQQARAAKDDPPQDINATRSVPPGRAPDSGPLARARAASVPDIEGYKITGVLGRGGMGVVYRAEQIKLRRVVALKLLPALIASASPSAVTRFRREATAAARLHHTNIVPVYDFGESRDGFYFAMELIEGRTLSDLIRFLGKHDVASASPAKLAEVVRNAVAASDDELHIAEQHPEPDSSGPRSSSTARSRAYYHRVARWIADIAGALHYAHGEGIIHRDIKPANILVAHDGRVMLADFGLAKSDSENTVTMTGSLLGTVRYLSPEQAMAGRMVVDRRTDLFSLGATLYELLCFQPAFPGSDDKQVLAAIITRDPTRPRRIAHTVPDELDVICMKALEKAQEVRFQTAGEIVEELERFLDDRPIVTRRPGIIKRTGKFVRRRPAFTSAIAIFCLLVAAVFFLQQEILEGKRKDLASKMTAANDLLDGDNYSEAMDLCDAILNDYPDHVGAFSTRASAKLYDFERRQTSGTADSAALETALKDCDSALTYASNPERRATILNIKGSILTDLKRYDQAESILAASVEGDDAEPYNWMNLAFVSFSEGDYPKAEERLLRAVELAAKLKSAGWKPYCHPLRELAVTLYLQADPDALETIDRAIRCDVPESPWFNLVKGRFLLTLRNDTDVAAAKEELVQANVLAKKQDPLVKQYLALARLRLGDYGKAIDEAELAIDLKGDVTFNSLVLTIAYNRTGNVKAAAEARARAKGAWPEGLRKAGAVRRRRPNGIFWYDSADEYLALAREADESSLSVGEKVHP